MSSAHSSSGAKGLYGKVTETLTDLVSPRKHRNKPSAVEAVTNAITLTRDAVMGVLGATAQLPFAAAEMAIAIPNNAIGALTTVVDDWVVQPIDTLRSKVWELFWSPRKFFGGSGGGAAVAHGHA